MKTLIATIRLMLIMIDSLMMLIVGYIVFLFTFGSRWSSCWTLKIWSRIALFFLNVKVERSGHSQLKSVIIMPNHRSYIDIFLVQAYSPASIVAKREIGKWPILGLSVPLVRMILVDRRKMSSKLETMKQISHEIEQGGSVILFPEGTTHFGPLTKTFQAGSFKIAVQTNTAIVPVAINYEDPKDAWVGDDLFVPHFIRQMGKWRTSVKLNYGSPVLFEDHIEAKNTIKHEIDKQLSIWNNVEQLPINL